MIAVLVPSRARAERTACNVIVYDAGGGETVVAAVDPDAMLSIVGENPAVAEVARDAGQRLKAAIRSIE